jgi:hypothetical protein
MEEKIYAVTFAENIDSNFNDEIGISVSTMTQNYTTLEKIGLLEMLQKQLLQELKIINKKDGKKD